MALKAPVKQAGDFFEPSNHMNDMILLIEGKRILKDQNYTDFTTKQPGKRDVAVADIYCWRNSQDIDEQEPSVVLKDAQITHGVLVGDIEANGWLDGDGGFAVIRRPKGTFFAYRYDFSPEAEAAATAWYERREANRASAADDMPDY